MRSELLLRFDNGHVVPWRRTEGRRLRAMAGPDSVVVDGDVLHTVHDFALAAGEVPEDEWWLGWQDNHDAGDEVDATLRSA